MRLLPPALLGFVILYLTVPPPGWLLVAGGLLLPWVRAQARGALLLGLPVLVLVLVWQVGDGPRWTLQYLGYTLVPLEGSPAGRLFATVFTLAAFAGGWFAWRRATVLELSAAMVYAGGAVSVALAGDWITVFVFWELMAIGSTLIVWAGGTPAAWAAAQRYILIHLLGGVLLMAGIAGHIAGGGDPALGPVVLEGFASWLILLGVLVNVAAPPLWSWVADAYPEASPSGTVFLSAFTTKTAVFVLWVAYPGLDLLVPVGLIMIVYGIVFALLENEVRRLLAYSLVSQVGYMVTAIGVGNEMALAGAAAHAFAHIIYKALLLMAMGAVILETGRRTLDQLGGLYRSMPVTAVCCLIGGLAISAAPLTSGFVAKALITDGLAEAHATVAWYIVMGASAVAFLYVGLRVPYLVFFRERDDAPQVSGGESQYRGPLVLLAALCIVVGVVPGWLYGLLPFPVDYQPYTVSHVLLQVQMLAVAAAVFHYTWPRLMGSSGRTWDLEWFYRAPGYRLLSDGTERVAESRNALERGLMTVWWRWIHWLMRHHGPEGPLARTWPSGSMVLWVAVLLLASLVFYYR